MKTKHVSRRLSRFMKADEAVSALEYAILVGVITVGVGGAIIAFSDNIEGALGTIGNGVTTTAGGNAVSGSPLNNP